MTAQELKVLSLNPPPGIVSLPSHTTTPKRILWRELLNRDWDAARLRLTLYPGDVFYNPEEYEKRRKRPSAPFALSHQPRGGLAEGGDSTAGLGVTTCLHIACRTRSPLDIIQRLLDLYPGAICRQDQEGWTPLHMHILHGSVGTVGNKARERDFCRVLGAMLHLSASNHGRYLHRQQYQVHSCHFDFNQGYGSTTTGTPLSTTAHIASVASVHAHTTGSPLHLFCCHGHHHDANELALLRSLVEADPTQVIKPDPNGCFPGTLLWRLYRNRHRRFLEAQGEQIPRQNRGVAANTNRSAMVPIPDPTSGIVEMLFIFLAAVRGDGQADQHTLQDVIAYQSKYAGPDRTDFVRLYLEMFPKSVGQWDEEGKLPIHVAAMAWPRHITRPSAVVMLALSPPRTLAACTVDPLWRLLRDRVTALPEMCGMVDVRLGRLPLHLVLTAPLQQLSTLQFQNKQKKNWTPPRCLAEDGGLAALVNAYPPALIIPDPQTGLPPAALAAWVNTRVRVTDEAAAVGFVYDILRLCPCVLSHSA